MRLFFRFMCVISLFCAVHFALAAPLKKIEENLNDSLITTKITTKFAQNENLDLLQIKVITTQNTVKLSGSVKNQKALLAAVELASQTDGVVNVDASDLHIQIVNTALTDAYITAKVEAAVLRAKIFDDSSIPIVGINASTTNGIVTITGQLNNQESLNMILKRVNDVRGVRKIISHLTVAT